MKVTVMPEKAPVVGGDADDGGEAALGLGSHGVWGLARKEPALVQPWRRPLPAPFSQVVESG